MKKVVVIGSINMDLVTVCERAPRGGETLLGKSFSQIPGGKGANQGVAIGKMETEITMLGKVGREGMGDIVLKSMKENGVDTSQVEYSENSTGIAKIILEENGENRILVVPGANFDVDIDYIKRKMDIIEKADIVVCQLEIPLETVKFSLKKAKELGKITILNPAPAKELDDEIIKNSDYIIPNETELEILSGLPTDTEENIEKAALKLIDKGVKGLIVTLGSKGCLYIDKERKFLTPAYKVKALDTTAAGDSFIGGFISGLCNSMNLEDSIQRGVAVAGIAVTRMGAQTSIPTLQEVIEFQKNS